LALFLQAAEDRETQIMGIQETSNERSAASTLIILSISVFLSACAANPMFETVGFAASGQGVFRGGEEIVGFVGGDVFVDDLAKKDSPRTNLEEDFDCEYEVEKIFSVADFNEDGRVDYTDMKILMSHWGTAFKPVDLNLDGNIDGEDLAILLSYWSGDNEDSVLSAAESDSTATKKCKI